MNIHIRSRIKIRLFLYKKSNCMLYTGKTTKFMEQNRRAQNYLVNPNDSLTFKTFYYEKS